jgi:hypothetical protein
MIQQAASTIGLDSWQVLMSGDQPLECPINPVHAALLYTGQVFFFSGSGNDPNNPPGPSVILDVGTGTFTTQDPPMASGASADLFCAGQSFRSGGSLMVAGGTLQYDPFYGSTTAFLFNPVTQQWTQVASMNSGRWYPTVVTLGDGRILALSGLDINGNLDQQPEIYIDSTTGWRAYLLTTSFFPMYSHLFLLSSGKLFYSGANAFGGADPSPRLLTLPSDFTQPITEQQVDGLIDADFPNQAASMLLPPAQNQNAMIIGGGNADDVATSRVNIVDLRVSNPTYTAGPSLNYARMHHSAVLLPDRTVFVCNGSTISEDIGHSVLPAEIYDPYATNPVWSVAATPTISGRVYHSVALLLPDGRVLTAGGNPSRGVYENRLEIYYPAYMSQPRPLIQSAPSSVVAGGTITIQTPQASTIQGVHLMRPMATTHSWDTEQRLVDLPISSRSNTSLTVTVLSNRNLAPMGWYMLFITNNNRVPSVANWIQLT